MIQPILFLFSLLTSLMYYTLGKNIPTATALGNGRKPNIVLIMADDMGYECLSSYGSAIYNTPNLDKLAGQDVLFFDVAKDVREQQPFGYRKSVGSGKGGLWAVADGFEADAGRALNYHGGSISSTKRLLNLGSDGAIGGVKSSVRSKLPGGT